MTIESGQIYAERYKLDTHILTNRPGSTWKAFDKALNRWVCLFLLPVTNPHSTILTTNCEQIGGIENRGVVSLYDVIHAAPLEKLVADGNPNQYFTGIVTEWVVGQTFADLLNLDDEGMRPLDALKMCKSIAETMEIVHSHGVTHNMLAPHNIIFADSNEVRILGLGIDKSLEHDHLPESVNDDIRALGSILFAALTHTMWVEPPRELTRDAQSNGLVPPSSYVASIPTSIDELYEATQNHTIHSMHELAERISHIIGDLDTESPLPGVQQEYSAAVTLPRPSNSKKTLTLALIFVLILGWSGWKLITMNIHRNGVPMALLPTSQWSATPSASPQTSKTPIHFEYATITSIRDYDPLGSGEENSDQVSNAIDNNYATSWSTVQYRQDNLSGKAGVGLLIDLGSSQKVKAVSTYFVDPGANVEIYVTDEANPDVKNLTPFGSATDVDLNTVISSTSGQSGRYVLVWLTYLPLVANGSYQAGIAEVQVRL